MNPLCSICLETIDVDHQCQTNCNHIFCKVCLDKWFDKEKISCPMCRTKIQYFQHQGNSNRIVCIRKKEPVIRNQNPQRIVISRNTFLIMNFFSLFSFSLTFLILYYDSKCEEYPIP